MEPDLEVDDEDLCDCGHPGYDGHDMRSIPPECMTPGCDCGVEPDGWREGQPEFNGAFG